MGDLKRRINPLRQAEDAIVIDSTKMTMVEVAQRILELVGPKAARIKRPRGKAAASR